MSQNDLNTLLKLQKKTERLQRLVEISVSLNSTLNLNELLATIIETAADVLGCEASSILLFDEQSGHLYFAAATGSDVKKLSEIPVPVDNSLAGRIFNTNEPVIINTIEHEPQHNKEASEHVGFQTRSLLGVPLKMRDLTIGVLEALNKKSGLFTKDDVEMLSVVASHAAVAIHNAQLIQALKDAYDEVSKADELKRNFLAVASHELRTPLGIIIGYASFLREESGGEASEHAEHVLSAALQMRALLEDMNNLTILEKDASVLHPRKEILQELLERAVDEIQEMAIAKGQKIILKFPTEPVHCILDAKKFTAAVASVLHNAIRFSPENERIFLGLEADVDNVLCWVKDHGMGIAEDQLEIIFKKFYQVEAPDTRHYGGMGIGLTIAKGLIEVQGGKIWAESDGLGKGTTFVISLPYRDVLPS